MMEMGAKMQRKQENHEVTKQAISGIENTNNIGLSSPVVENLENELNILLEEQNLALKKGKSRPGLITAKNTAFGLAGGCATFLVSFIAVFICSADVAGLLRSTTNINLSGGQVVPYLFLSSTIMSLVFLVGFAIFASRRQKQLLHDVSSRQRQLEEAIDEQQRSIATETTKHFDLINEGTANQQLAIEKEVEVAKESIKKEISERQEQLDKHYNRVKI
jgi:heme exporter protein D